MKIKKITIEKFKNINKITLDNLRDINVLIGKNNSGKTSIIEAIISFFAENLNDGLYHPPFFQHYNKKESKDEDSPLIEISFEVEDDFTESFNFNPEYEEIFKKYYKKDIIIKRRDLRPSIDNVSKLEIIFQIDIENVEKEDILIVKEINKMIIGKIFKYYNKRIKYVSPMDGFRTNFKLNKFYDVYYGLGRTQDNFILRQSIIGNISSVYGYMGDIRRYIANDYLQKFNRFSKIQSDLFITPKGNPVIEFGKREKLRHLSYYYQGDGELDNSEIYFSLDPINNNDKSNLFLIDEPENHKHISYQRDLLNLILEKSNDIQFFISTHSPVFASKFADLKVGVYLINRDENKDENNAKLISNISSGLEIRNALGLINIDSFFNNAILFVEGATEQSIIPSILSYFKTNENILGLKIYSVGGIGKISYKRMRETFDILKETNIIPIIIFDQEEGAEQKRKDITKKYNDLFIKDIQYHIWDTNFVGDLPRKIVLEAFKNLLSDHKIFKLEEKDLKVINQSKMVEDEMRRIYWDLVKGDFSKTDFANYLEEEMQKSDNESLLKKNKIFLHIKSIITFVENINKKNID